MRIYPDPELPDIEVNWYASDCGPDSTVQLSLVGTDTPTFRSERAVPCVDEKVTFVDVARERYRIRGQHLSAGMPELGEYEQELDLRNGFDARVEMYFGSYDNVRVGWTFAMGATCETLGAEAVILAFTSSSFSEPLELGTDCSAMVSFAYLPDGVFTVIATALTSDEIPVAVSAPSPEFTVDSAAFPDLDVELVPCGGPCP